MPRSKKKKPAGIARPPGLGRNLARRPGGGVHRSAADKRAQERLRRELDEQRADDA